MPARPGESVFGSTSFVHVRPPPTRFTKRSAGSWTRRRIPLVSFLRILKRADSSLLGFTPPPQRRVPRFASSARLAFIAAGASAVSRFEARRCRRPFFTRIPRRTLR